MMVSWQRKTLTLRRLKSIRNNSRKNRKKEKKEKKEETLTLEHCTYAPTSLRCNSTSFYMDPMN